MSAATDLTSVKAYRATTLRGGGLILTIVTWLVAVAGLVMVLAGAIDTNQAALSAIPMAIWLLAAAAITQKRSRSARS